MLKSFRAAAVRCVVSLLLVFSNLGLTPDQVLAESANLIVNGDFESGNMGAFTKSWGTGTASITDSAADVRSGNYALQYEGEGAVDLSLDSLEPNTSYKLVAYAKAEMDSRVSIGVKNYGGPEVNQIAETTVYTPITFRFTTGLTSSALLYVYNMGGTGKVFTDDITLVKEPVMANAIENGDFETGYLAPAYKAWGSGTASIHAGQAHNGSYGVEYEGEGAINFNITGLSPDSDYVLTAYAKLGTSTKATIGVKNHGGDEQYVAINGNDYNKYTLPFTTGQGFTSAQVYLYNEGGSGTIYADDFEILIESRPPPISTEDVTNNGIFPASDPDNTRNWQYSLDYSDEFDNNSLDTEKWNDHHTYWEGRQPSIFSPANISQKDGKLTLTAKYETIPAMAEANAKLGPSDPVYENYTTAAVQSKTKSSYGYYEIKAKAAPISMTSSFWLQGSETEIDVYETVGRSNVYQSSRYVMPMNTHYFPGGDWTKDVEDPMGFTTDYDLTQEYHVYGLDWNEKWIRYYFDGKLVREKRNDVFHEPQYIFMDMETFTWHGLPSEESLASPNGDYGIEYMRVWRSTDQVSDEPEYVMPAPKEAVAEYGTPAISATNPDPKWSKAKEIGRMHVKGGSTTNTAVVKTMWDQEYLYIHADVKDKDITGSEPTETYKNDSIEVYIDKGNEKAKPYDSNDIKVNVDYLNRMSGVNLPEGIIKSVHETADGYVVEMAIPWGSTVVEKDRVLGFDIQVNDARQPTGVRQGYLGWNDPLDKVWADMGMAGNLKLAPQVQETPAQETPSGGTQPTPSSGNQPTPSSGNQPTSVIPDSIELKINQENLKAGKLTRATSNGQSISTIRLDSAMLEKKLATEGDGTIIVVPVNNKSDVVISELSGQLIAAMAQRNAALELRSEFGSYILPAKQIDLKAISQKLRKQVQPEELIIGIQIALTSTEEQNRVGDAIAKKGLTLIGHPVHFSVTATLQGEQSVELTSFQTYVERTIVIPSNVEPAQITTAVVVERDGTLRPIPTKIQKESGNHFAKIKSLTNSTYALVGHTISFRDLSHSWSAEAIHQLASRMVVNGSSEGMFNPGQKITRAEFTTMLVKALGLKTNLSPTVFSDVRSAGWYSGYIQAAAQNQWVNGFTDGTFRPDHSVTREQAMVVISKAIANSGMGKDILPIPSLNSFKDAQQVSSWAETSVAECVASGIVSTTESGFLRPKAVLTREEAATMIYRVLQSLELI